MLALLIVKTPLLNVINWQFRAGFLCFACHFFVFCAAGYIKGASTAEFIKTKREYDKLRAEVEEMGRIADEIEAAMYEAHLDEFVNTFFEEKFGEIGDNDILVLEIEF